MGNESIFKNSDELKEKVWSVWVGKYHNLPGDFDEVWPTYKKLSDETGIEIPFIKNFIKDCRDVGIAYSTPIVNGEEGMFAGKGNFVYSRFQKPTNKEALSLKLEEVR